MQEKKLYEDLQYIKQIINDSRNLVVENGIGFIIWGILIVIGLLYTYFDFLLKAQLHNNIAWVVLISGGWILSFISAYKKREHSNVTTFAGKLLSSVWISAGIAMTILGFIGSASGAYKGVYISPILSTILGIAFFISAQVYKNKIMTLLAPLWWLGAIYMFFFPGLETLLIMAFMMLLMQVVPGIIFYRKYRAENYIK